jgi:hypothetical protein
MIKNGLVLIIVSIFILGNTVPSKDIVSVSKDLKVSVSDTLPPPYATKSSRNYSKVIGWHHEKTPIVPEGFVVARFADNLDNPRWI